MTDEPAEKTGEKTEAPGTSETSGQAVPPDQVLPERGMADVLGALVAATRAENEALGARRYRDIQTLSEKKIALLRDYEALMKTWKATPPEGLSAGQKKELRALARAFEAESRTNQRYLKLGLEVTDLLLKSYVEAARVADNPAITYGRRGQRQVSHSARVGVGIENKI